MATEVDIMTGVGFSKILKVLGFNKHTLSIKFTDIGTSVTMNLQGSHNNVDWFELSRDDFIFTADDTHAFVTNVSIDFLRVHWINKDGGTGTKFTILYKGDQ